MINKKNIFPIAIGTYGLGMKREEVWEETSDIDISDYKDVIDALMFSFKNGQNYIETSFIYGGGKTLRILKHFFKLIPRDKIFITVKIENYVNEIQDIEKQLDKYLSILDISYADSILLHTPKVTNINLIDCYKELERLVSIGKSRFVSASNLNYKQLKEIVINNNTKLFSFEGLYNLDCKYNEDVKIIGFCNQNDILFVNYQPFRRNRITNKNYPLLTEISNKYNATQHQILLNWMIKEKHIYPITMSINTENIKSNIESLNIEIDSEDYNKLNEFRNKEFDELIVDWDDYGGTPIYKIANQLE